MTLNTLGNCICCAKPFSTLMIGLAMKHNTSWFYINSERLTQYIFIAFFIQLNTVNYLLILWSLKSLQERYLYKYKALLSNSFRIFCGRKCCISLSDFDSLFVNLGWMKRLIDFSVKQHLSFCPFLPIQIHSE